MPRQESLQVDKHQHLPDPPTQYRRGTPKAMTIAAGFRCRDGVLLCADSEITLMRSKAYQVKVLPVNSQADAYLACAGVVAFAKELRDKLKLATKGQRGQGLLRIALRQFYKLYSCSGFNVSCPNSGRANLLRGFIPRGFLTRS